MSDSWKPVTYVQLVNLVSHNESQLEERLSTFWQAIRLPAAELWQQHPWGNEGCGFWVIATAGRTCIYYNDIKEGFSIGHFQRWGHISDYQVSQSTLQTTLEALLHAESLTETA